MPGATPEWYRDWFGEEYLALYPHRDAMEARAAVSLVLETCGRPAGPLLDLACGAGRHMLEFENQGMHAIGLDLSSPLLHQARRRGGDLMLVQGDMRHLPFGDGSFDMVVNFFTSFGYFAAPEEDEQVLDEIRRVLREEGRFMLDFLNAERVRQNLVERDERIMPGRRVVQRRRLVEGGKVVLKEIQMLSEDGEQLQNTYYERVRLYAPEELIEMLEGARLEVQITLGDYFGGTAVPDSPRHILIGQAL